MDQQRSFTPSNPRTLRLAGRLLALLALLAAIVAVAAPAAASPPAAQEVNELDLIVIVDNSASMCCPPIMNDEDNDRGQFARLFVQLLGVDQSEADYRLGFVFFGTDAHLIAPLSPISTDAERDALQATIDNAEINLGWTDVSEALQAAGNELAANGRPGAQQAVVLLTDGEPRLPDWPNEGADFEAAQSAYMADLRAYIDANWPDDIPIFTVAFSEEAFRANPNNLVFKNLFQELAVITGAPADVGYQEATTDEGMGDVYFKIIRSLLGLPTDVTLEPPVAVPVVKDFDIDEELAQVIFVVLKDNPNITTTITDPQGNVIACPLANDVDSPIACERGQREETISVRSPGMGTWRVSLDGQGFIQFQAVPFPLDLEYAFELMAPLRGHPAGKPLELVARVIDRETGAMAPAQNVSVTVEYPSGAESAALPMNPVDDTLVAMLDDTREVGVYTLRFSGDVADGTLHGDSSVQVLLSPWLRIDAPVGGGFPSNVPVDITAQLMWSDQPLPQIDQSWTLNASANVYDESGAILKTVQLQPEADAAFHGQMDPGGAEGQRELVVSMLIETAGGEKFADETRGAFVVGPATPPTATPPTPPTPLPAPSATPAPLPTPTPVPEPTDPKVVAGGGLLGLLVVAGLVGGFIYMRRPKLTGDIQVEGGSYYALKGSQSAIIGRDPKSKIVINDDSAAPKHAQLRPRGGGSVELVNLAPTSSDPDDPAFAPLQVKGRDEASFQDVIGGHFMEDGDKIRIGDTIMDYINATPGGGFQEYAGDDEGEFHFDDDNTY